MEPGSPEAIEKGCTCTPADIAAVLDVLWAMIDAVHGGLSGGGDSSSLPKWNTCGCPLHGSPQPQEQR